MFEATELANEREHNINPAPWKYVTQWLLMQIKKRCTTKIKRSRKKSNQPHFDNCTGDNSPASELNSSWLYKKTCFIWHIFFGATPQKMKKKKYPPATSSNTHTYIENTSDLFLDSSLYECMCRDVFALCVCIFFFLLLLTVRLFSLARLLSFSLASCFLPSFFLFIRFFFFNLKKCNVYRSPLLWLLLLFLSFKQIRSFVQCLMQFMPSCWVQAFCLPALFPRSVLFFRVCICMFNCRPLNN